MNSIQKSVCPKSPDIILDDRVDMDTVRIDKDAPQLERAIELIKQIKNPYAFRCGDVAVNIEFTAGGKRLDELLLFYLQELRNKQ